MKSRCSTASPGRDRRDASLSLCRGPLPAFPKYTASGLSGLWGRARINDVIAALLAVTLALTGSWKASKCGFFIDAIYKYDLLPIMLLGATRSVFVLGASPVCVS